MDWLTRLTQRQHGEGQRLTALLVGQVLFWIGFPVFIVAGSFYIDSWLHLLRFVYGPANPIVALLLMVPGGLFAEWAVYVQFSLGRGTPLPVVATRRLIIERPYTYCRNPMALGTTMVYLGVAIWVGSPSAIALASIYPSVIVIYTKLFEEKELEKRFGSEYLQYKKRTPFVIPRLWQRE
jgi:protein-S-isoprenylcysteine O-methyltransferase Ste14